MANKYLHDQFKSLVSESNIKKLAISSVLEAENQAISKYKKRYLQKLFPAKVQAKRNSIGDASELRRYPKSQETRQKEQREEAPIIERARELTKRLRKHRLDREKRQQYRFFKHEMREEEFKALELRQKEETEKLKKLKKEEQKQRYSKLRKKHHQRKEEYEQHKLAEQEYRKQMKKVPLYRKIEEKFNNSVLLPELDRKKAQLASKRKFPIDPKLIRDHAQVHDTFIKHFEIQTAEKIAQKELRSKKYLQSVYNSQFFFNMKEDNTNQIKTEREKVNKKHELVSKKKQYSAVVKEIYKPSPKKLIPTVIHTKSKSCEVIPPKKKWKKNPLVLPSLTVRKTSNVVDYLKERREHKKQSVMNWTHLKTPSDIKSLASKMESSARLKETQISPFDSSKNSEIRQEVSDLFLNSIKAKLSNYVNLQ